jgi:Zn2+/Cd2+-exporting ATPase
VGTMETHTYRVEGLTCVDCAGRIEAAVGRLDGVQGAEANAATGMLTFKVSTPEFDVGPVARIVADTGHKLVMEPGAQRPAGGFMRFMLGSPATTLTAIAGVLVLVGLALSLAGLWLAIPGTIARVAFGAAILVGGATVVRAAYQEVWIARGLGINALMVIAVVGAVLIGEWAEAAVVVVLFSLGDALEGYAAERARGALESLLDLVPPVALRFGVGGVTEPVPVEALSVGDRVLVRPGDRVSVDGVVAAGQSAVDQAAITGESMPVDKVPGDDVFAGTINTFGALEVTVRRLAEDSTLSRMVALVREAQARQAPIQRFVDRFARVYTPVVAVVALLVAVLPPLAFGQPFWGDQGWLMRALQLLVIACPCALVISTPVAVVSALTRAASEGVLIKGGRTLEALGRVDVFAFDKTGTLTEGKPVITDVLSVCGDGSHPHGALEYAAAVEAQSSHPLARALVAEANARSVTLLPSVEVRVLGGQGVTGRVNGHAVTVGSHPYFDVEVPHSEAVCINAQRLAAQGKTVMMVCHDENVCSVLAVADTPRSEAAEVVAQLRRGTAGSEKRPERIAGLFSAGDGRARRRRPGSEDGRGVWTVMLTGDGEAVARTIGESVGVDEVRAELLPEQKVAAVRQLSEGGRVVAMVGDGVNDAPALAEATVGIAMGGAGSDQAMETADVVLMGDDLRKLPFVLGLSRRTQGTIQANIIAALAIKALVFVLAVLGVATLWMAIVADVGASMAVILNGMRLRHWELGDRNEDSG